MEIFGRVLQGPFVYILILQIFVVSSLLMGLLWLVVKRTRELEPEFAGGPIEGLAGVSSQEMDALKKKLDDLGVENGRLVSQVKQAEALVEKIKFLESKLLEYEILQEEIGTLSNLKIENEKLKSRVVELEKELRGAGSAAHAAAAAAPAPAPAPTPTPPPAPAPVVSAAPVAAPVIAETVAAPEPASEAIPQTPTAESNDFSGVAVPPPGPAVNDTPNIDSAGLEGLLKEIDSLSQQANK